MKIEPSGKPKYRATGQPLPFEGISVIDNLDAAKRQVREVFEKLKSAVPAGLHPKISFVDADSVHLTTFDLVNRTEHAPIVGEERYRQLRQEVESTVHSWLKESRLAFKGLAEITGASMFEPGVLKLDVRLHPALAAIVHAFRLALHERLGQLEGYSEVRPRDWKQPLSAHITEAYVLERFTEPEVDTLVAALNSFNEKFVPVPFELSTGEVTAFVDMDHYRPVGASPQHKRSSVRQPMLVMDPPRQNVTLVAAANPALLDLVKAMRNAITEHPATKSLVGDINWYADKQLHLTLIGLEAIRIDTELFNVNFLNNNGTLRTMDRDGFFTFLRTLARSRNPLFRLRFGGFRRAFCSCAGSDLHEWKCESGAEFHSFSRSAYEGSFYAVQGGPMVVTGWPIDSQPDPFNRTLYGFRKVAENFGYLDKYHSNEKLAWKDDDGFLVLGRLGKIEDEKREALEATGRGFLSEMPPHHVDITMDDIYVVRYGDTQLKDAEWVPLRDLLTARASVFNLYDRLEA